MSISTSARLLPLALLLAAGQAAAQQPPPPSADPVDNAPVHIGPFGLSPGLVVRDIGRDANVFNDATDPKSDFTMTVSPTLGVVVHPGPLLVSYSTTTDYVYYRTYKSERGTNLGSALRLDFDFGPLKPFLSAAAGNTRGRLNREIDVRARHHDQSYGGGVRLQLLDALFATVGARQSKTDYDADAVFRGQALDRTLNATVEAIDAGVGVALTPLTTVQVVVTRERNRFELSPDRDSETLRVMPTVTFSPLAMLNGSAAFGYRRFTTHSPLVPGFAGFVSTVTLGSTVRERHRLETTFSRDLSYSYEEDTAEYLETGVQATWTWQIGGPIDTRLSAGRSRLHYRGPSLTASNDDDTATNYQFSLGYRVKERLRVGLNGDWEQRDSERAADRAFRNRRIYANVTWGKQ